MAKQIWRTVPGFALRYTSPSRFADGEVAAGRFVPYRFVPRTFHTYFTSFRTLKPGRFVHKVAFDYHYCVIYIYNRQIMVILQRAPPLRRTELTELSAVGKCQFRQSKKRHTQLNYTNTRGYVVAGPALKTVI